MNQAMQKRQPSQNKTKVNLKLDQSVVDLLIELLNSLDNESNLSPASVKQFVEVSIKHFMSEEPSTQQSSSQNSKSIRNSIIDTIVLIWLRVASLNENFALQIVTSVIKIVQDCERKPSLNTKNLFLVFFNTLKLSKQLLKAAKSKELINKLIGLLSAQYTEDQENEAILNNYQMKPDMNLNQLIMAGNVNNQENYLQSQLNIQPQGSNVHGNDQTLDSHKGVAQKNNQGFNKFIENNQSPGKNSKNHSPAEVYRASSEPPNIYKNITHQVPEELKEVEFDQQTSLESNQKDKQAPPATKVPPIMVDQIIKQQVKNQAPVSGFQSTSTSVMNNFFNLPHGERFQANHSAVRGNSSATKTINYKYQAQSVIAQSRLTRRQFSISRVNSKDSSNNLRNKLKIRGSPSIERNPYSDDGQKGRNVEKVPVLNLNQIKAIENEKDIKQTEHEPQTFVNLPARQISDEGEDLDNSVQYDNKLLGTGQSAEQKLKQLAIQLGESCLTYDLAALMSQKRELDLATTARKAVHKPEFVKQLSLAVDRQRSISHMGRANSSFMLVSRAPQQYLNFRSFDQGYQTKLQTRVLVLNIVELLLREYSIEEARFLRKPTVLVTSFLNSDSAQSLRREDLVQELLTGIDLKKYHKNHRVQDYEQKYIYLNFSGKIQSESKHQQQDDAFSQFLAICQSPVQEKTSTRDFYLRQHNELFTRCKVLNELRVVQRILHQFSSVNEDILKSQIANEIKSFTARESNNMSVLNLNLPNSSAPSMRPSLGVQKSDSVYNYKFSERWSNFGLNKLQNVTPISKGKDCVSQISNPFQLWSNNGIGFDLSKPKDKLSTFVSEAHIRRKLDCVFNQVSRRITHIFQQGLEITSFEFADSLAAQISILNTYMDQHSSRIILKQFIEVCLEPILMVKKALVEITLEMRILALDLSRVGKSGLLLDLLTPKYKSAGSDMLLETSDNGNDELREDIRNGLIKSQARLRDLFAEFLLLIAIIIKRPQPQESLKLLNEVFFFDEVWSESVKAFTISLFLADLISPIYQSDFNAQQLQTFDQLRGINIVNFQEKYFFEHLQNLNSKTLVSAGKQAVYNSFIQAVSVLKYLNAMTNFFEFVGQMHFPANPHQSVVKRGQSEKFLHTEPQTVVPTQNLLQNSNNNQTNPDLTQKQLQKYWKTVVRRVLYQLMFLIDQPNGLFYLYIQKNCLNYSNSDIAAPTTRESQVQSQPTPVNFQITLQVLKFLKKIFNMPQQFTKYVFVEELMLFYIRTHYISFVKLYNKNYKRKRNEAQETNEQRQVVPSIELCKSHLDCLLGIAKQRTEDTRRKLYQFKICSFLLQEIGLEYEIQQRRQTFLKYRKQEQSKLEKPQTSPLAQKSGRNVQGANFLSQTTGNNVVQKIQQDATQNEQTMSQTQVKKGPPFIPSLKVGGLGFSTIQKENGKTQEELDVENLVKTSQHIPQQPKNENNSFLGPQNVLPVKKAPFIPALKVGGLGLSTLVKENGKTQEEMDVDAQVKQNAYKADNTQSLQKSEQIQQQQQQPVLKKAPFIPALKVGGLGFSNLQKDNGKTQEELDVDQLVKVSQMKPQKKIEQSDATDDSEYEIQVLESKRSQIQSKRNLDKNMDGEGSSSSDESYYRELEKIKQMAPPPSQKPMPQIGKLGFKLQLGGLGLSTLVKENGKTQEELDVEAQVKQTKPVIEKMQTLEITENKMFSRNTAFDKTDPEKIQNRYKQQSATPQLIPKANLLLAGQPEHDEYAHKSPNVISGFQESVLSTVEKYKLPEHSSNFKVSVDIDTKSRFKTTNQNSNQQQNNESASNTKPLDAVLEELMEAQNIARDISNNENPQNLDITEEMLYLNERQMRPIYQDEELHVLMLSLMMCLILKPQRGTLDELYCSQFPIDNEQQNFLYLLHFHLSNKNNQDITPKLLQKIQKLNPPLAGQRLLKLLCPSLFDLSLYNNGKGWIKLAEGAYGVVYEVSTSMTEPQTVAVKKMNLPQSIFDRCVLHDIFTEITCLEEFRPVQCVTDLYDYGVDESSYYIIMKRYSGSLKEWRIKQKPHMKDNLSLYLSIYREILKCLKAIHSKNVTHYDIKCDNVLIDFKGDPSQSKQNLNEEFNIIIGDFGECHMFTNEKDEFQSRNKGTEFIKSPEMLLLAIATRKDTDKYDRRKKVGTNSLSDVWSLGCLFYELLTGDVLFDTEEYFEFHVRLTKNTMPLITQEKLEKIDNNVYLIDFLKYVLVKDLQLRPTLDNVLKRFEHIHALLVNTNSTNDRFVNRQIDYSDNIDTNRVQKVSFPELLERAVQISKSNGQTNQTKNSSGVKIKQQNSYKLNQTEMPEIMKITQNVYLTSESWIRSRSQNAVKLGITHIVLNKSLLNQQLQNLFEVMEIEDSLKNSFLLAPEIMDFLRQVALKKGKVLFVETDYQWSNLNTSSIISEAMVICMTITSQTSAYETFTLIKSQNLFFRIETNRMIAISQFTSNCRKAQSYLGTFPQFSCICGASTIILKRAHATYQNMQIVTCRCSNYYKNVESSKCPSTGCNDFINFVQTYYKSYVTQQNILPDGKLHWGYVEADDFMFGPEGTGCTQNIEHRQIAMNLSKTIDMNTQILAVSEKLGSVDQTSSLSRRRHQQQYQNLATKANYNQVMQAPITTSMRETCSWQLFGCSKCQVWTHAYNEQDKLFAILLNNRLKEGQRDLQLQTLIKPQSQAAPEPALSSLQV